MAAKQPATTSSELLNRISELTNALKTELIRNIDDSSTKTIADIKQANAHQFAEVLLAIETLSTRVAVLDQHIGTKSTKKTTTATASASEGAPSGETHAEKAPAEPTLPSNSRLYFINELAVGGEKYQKYVTKEHEETAAKDPKLKGKTDEQLRRHILANLIWPNLDDATKKIFADELKKKRAELTATAPTPDAASSTK